MTTKDWLNRARGIDKEVQALVDARHAAYMACISTTPRLRADIVSSDKDPHAKMERLANLNCEIDNRIDTLLAVQVDTLNAINKVCDTTHRMILAQRYVYLKSWEQIAISLGVPESTARGRLHGEAIKSFATCCGNY